MFLNQKAHKDKPSQRGPNPQETREKEASGGRFNRQEIVLLMGVSVRMIGVRATRAASLHTRPKSFGHDLLDGARATSALGAAAQAVVNLSSGARKVFAGHRASYVVIGDDVAGTNNHGWKLGNPVKTWGIDMSPRPGMQSQSGQFQAIPNWDASCLPDKPAWQRRKPRHRAPVKAGRNPARRPLNLRTFRRNQRVPRSTIVSECYVTNKCH